MFLGILLVFGFYPKRITWSAIAFLGVVSLIYLYGLLAKGITDCGCFGPITWLNSKPWLTFTRNGIMLAMLIPSILKTEEQPSPTISSVIFMAVIAVVVMFMCGFSFRDANCLQKQNYFRPTALADSKLAELVTCDNDSTYLVFAFSYNCPFCQNSIGNVNQYESMHFVDKVIGVAVEDSLARERFERIFQVNFPIQEISEWQMYQLTKTLPAAYIIRHDSIISQFAGMVVSPALLLP